MATEREFTDLVKRGRELTKLRARLDTATSQLADSIKALGADKYMQEHYLSDKTIYRDPNGTVLEERDGGYFYPDGTEYSGAPDEQTIPAHERMDETIPGTRDTTVEKALEDWNYNGTVHDKLYGAKHPDDDTLTPAGQPPFGPDKMLTIRNQNNVSEINIDRI